MPVTYTLDESVATFLSTQTDTTREDCDILARSLLSSEPLPVSIQGAFSYTVANQSQLVQFRAPSSPLDIEVLRQARSIHGHLIANTTYHGQLGQDRPLLVYIIEKLPGITYLEYQLRSGVHQSLDELQYKRQQTLVKDFAQFFAASSETPQAVDTATIRQTFENDLRLLARTLPTRFSQDTIRLLDSLDLMFESLPTVLTHGDLCEMNFLVDESSGHLTGVIDWAEGEVLPFGLSLWGLENILGYMDLHGWHYFDQHADLRALFWRTFHSTIAKDNTLVRKQGAIDLAVRLGILFRYAFRWDDNMQREVVQEGDSGTRFLDALFS